MTDSVGGPTPTNPFEHQPNHTQQPTSGKRFEAGGSGMNSFKNWLGPQGYKKFKATLLKWINTEIQRQEKQMKKANEKLKRVAKGED